MRGNLGKDFQGDQRLLFDCLCVKCSGIRAPNLAKFLQGRVGWDKFMRGKAGMDE